MDKGIECITDKVSVNSGKEKILYSAVFVCFVINVTYTLENSGILELWPIMGNVVDLYIFGPSGSGSVSHRYVTGSGSFCHQAKKNLDFLVLFYCCDFFMAFYLRKIM